MKSSRFTASNCDIFVNSLFLADDFHYTKNTISSASQISRDETLGITERGCESVFKMTLNQKERVILISYSGYFTVHDAKLFMKELHDRLQIIRPEEYVLVIDMQEVKPSSLALVPLLDEIKHIYMNAPFKYVYSVASDAWITPRPKRKSGASRSNWSLVQTVDEALELVKQNNRSENE